ncbi:MAG: radical SAM protein [Euryarchaeota archaeon]|nr:radical SAM protein [Euryarchaeota archaeon]
MLDPITSSKALERMVTKHGEKGLLRKYYRFRPARFYGGIATADAVGCNLNCAFCWVKEPRLKPWKYGEFYSPGEVASKLEEIARRGRFSKVRVSGAEPTIGREHLVELINVIDKDLLFILETNGMLIGYDESYAREFVGKNVYVRVALKGASSEEFALLTNAKPEFYDYQIKALENLEKYGISYRPALMTFSKNIQGLKERLEKVSPGLSEEIEIEELMLFPHVKKELEKKNIL